jgi:hypothetical protein
VRDSIRIWCRQLGIRVNWEARYPSSLGCGPVAAYRKPIELLVIGRRYNPRRGSIGLVPTEPTSNSTLEVCSRRPARLARRRFPTGRTSSADRAAQGSRLERRLGVSKTLPCVVEAEDGIKCFQEEPGASWPQVITGMFRRRAARRKITVSAISWDRGTFSRAQAPRSHWLLRRT